MTEIENPYAAPSAEITYEENLSKSAVIRKKYISHETSVKSIGNVYIFGSIFILLIGLSMFAGSMSYFVDPLRLFISIVVMALCLTQFYVGLHVRRLAPWTRIGIGIFSTLWLLFVPIGTILGPYFLYLTFSSKGQVVFSKEYREIIKATPDMKYKTPALHPAVGYVLLGLLILCLLFAIFFGSR